MSYLLCLLIVHNTIYLNHHFVTVHLMIIIPVCTFPPLVKSWDGGASVLGCGPPTEGRRGDRDTWDEELDRGKVGQD